MFKMERRVRVIKRVIKVAKGDKTSETIEGGSSPLCYGFSCPLFSLFNAPSTALSRLAAGGRKRKKSFGKNIDFLFSVH
jgi:hypothetical protein